MQSACPASTLSPRKSLSRARCRAEILAEKSAPDRIDLWRLEQAIEGHVIAMLGPGSAAAASVATSDPGFGNAPEWLIEHATPGLVRVLERGGEVRSPDR